MDILQEYETGEDLILGFPEENSIGDTDEDSDDKANPSGDPSHFSRKLLTTHAFFDDHVDAALQESPEDPIHGQEETDQGPQCKR